MPNYMPELKKLFEAMIKVFEAPDTGLQEGGIER